MTDSVYPTDYDNIDSDAVSQRDGNSIGQAIEAIQQVIGLQGVYNFGAGGGDRTHRADRAIWSFVVLQDRPDLFRQGICPRSTAPPQRLGRIGSPESGVPGESFSCRLAVTLWATRRRF